MARKDLELFQKRRARLDDAARFALGEERPRDYARAIRLYRLESKAGSGEASYNLATMYCRGEGTKRNWLAAIKLFRLGEKQGSTDSSLVLGELALKRNSKSRANVQSAIAHFAIAAFRGDIRGLREIASAIQGSPQLQSLDIAQAIERSVRAITRHAVSRK